MRILLSLLVVCVGVQGNDLWRGHNATTSIDFNQEIIKDLGLIVAAQVETAQPSRSGYIGFETSEESSILFRAPNADFEVMDSGWLVHVGGFVFERAGETFSFIDFQLRAVPGTTDFEMLDNHGNRLFTLEFAHPHFDAQAKTLGIRNMDMRLSSEFARRLGRPDLQGLFFGMVDVEFQLQAPPGFVFDRAGACTADFSGDVDVQLDDMFSLSQAAREAGVRVAMAPSARLSNVGTADVRWYNAIAPSLDTGQHPYLVFAMYRLLDGRFDQIGRSDVKHAFFSVNSGCSCVGGHVLYVGCGDTYSSGTNLRRDYLAPREEITASTGSWTPLGSHFDVYPNVLPADAVRSHFGDPAHDSFEHRLTVPEPALQTAGARYFIEGWYVVQGDVNIFNGIGWREIDPSLTGSVWSFPMTTPLAHGPAIDVFVDPSASGAGNYHAQLDSGEGHLRLAVHTTDLGGGQTRFEYTLMNLDFDRKIDNIHIPLGLGGTVTDAEVRDGDDDSGNDWVVWVNGSELEVIAANGNELDWGQAISFGYEADSAPVSATASLSVFEAGSPLSLAATTLAPFDVCGPNAILDGYRGWPKSDVTDLVGLFCD